MLARMKIATAIAARLDAICARLNAGLLAVAIVLAVVNCAVALAQAPDIPWQVADIPAP
jgi:hypothetical protein